MAEALAIHGGPKVKTTPFGTGKRFGEEELKELREALEQDTLFYHYGEKVKSFLKKFNEMYGVRYSVAASSGTAAIHVALGAAGVTAGDEVITSPITDQGTVIGILYQNAIPVFADVLPDTYNMDPASIEARITKRTKAIVAVHLAGNPCDMDAIMAIARKHGLKVIEDCAQSYMSVYKGKLVGTIGDYGCFSTNDFKHISTGDGGMVTVNSGDAEDYAIVHAFADKNYERFDTKVSRDIHHLAPNYRMTELQGAVGIAQLDKLAWICDKRQEYGTMLTDGLTGIPGILPPCRHGGLLEHLLVLFVPFGYESTERYRGRVRRRVERGRHSVHSRVYSAADLLAAYVSEKRSLSGHELSLQPVGRFLRSGNLPERRSRAADVRPHGDQRVLHDGRYSRHGDGDPQSRDFLPEGGGKLNDALFGGPMAVPDAPGDLFTRPIVTQEDEEAARRPGDL
ncbi:DegT/DnrJ/EryC1/StrS family aminotransferase [Cohnella rhizosphaerae]|uniref:DegT/DnrJ/EryC1/StrS family aminotransferase n=1 Tax=Cohnella rhizosphaerae TaxID=1457232 RepID=A0A9X4KZ25_9BACL|nr:DegT/DnrJ/EryC1/StrS family aminotransferase [Cohnella rhizosphaerae]MDG0813587.1 DegT/DnrJ/EryC1/StrS family aminotransferase [Cohnella rhizosphaerae]